MADAPVVYVLHGDDEYEIAQWVLGLEGKLGDPALAAMNTTRLDGRTYNPDELLNIAAAMPFLAKRRLVILTHPLAKLTTDAARKKFLETLARIPATTALLLVEFKPLTEEKERRKNRINWLETWAAQNSGRAYLRSFDLPHGPAMDRWIQDKAKSYSGQFSPQGAALLRTLVDEDPRLADQEIQKLLAYVNYRRPVEADDVETLTTDYASGDIFKLVDAMGSGNGRLCMDMLHRLLEQQTPLEIFPMIQRQFRLLLLVREALDAGVLAQDVPARLKQSPYVIKKIIDQVRHFTLADLEVIYHRLLEIDEAIKTGRVSGELALDQLVASLAK